jgi:hypothetical protein
MRRTSLMSLLFFVWGIAVFFMPDFRQSFPAPLISTAHQPWHAFRVRLPDKMLEQTAKLAEIEARMTFQNRKEPVLC